MVKKKSDLSFGKLSSFKAGSFMWKMENFGNCYVTIVKKQMAPAQSSCKEQVPCSLHIRVHSYQMKAYVYHKHLYNCIAQNSDEGKLVNLSNLRKIIHQHFFQQISVKLFVDLHGCWFKNNGISEWRCWNY